MNQRTTLFIVKAFGQNRPYSPFKRFIVSTATRRTVSLSSFFTASIGKSWAISSIYRFIFSRRRRSISLWLILSKKKWKTWQLFFFSFYFRIFSIWELLADGDIDRSSSSSVVCSSLFIVIQTKTNERKKWKINRTVRTRWKRNVFDLISCSLFHFSSNEQVSGRNSSVWVWHNSTNDEYIDHLMQCRPMWSEWRATVT